MSTSVLPVAPDVTDPANLRRLHSDLVNGLPGLPPKEFALALTYKGLVEDVLQNLLEDDSIPLEFSQSAIAKLVSSYEAARQLSSDTTGSAGPWLSALEDFSRFYKTIVTLRRTPSHVTCNHLRFVGNLGSDEGLMLGPPVAKQRQDSSYRWFPTLDHSVLDPDNGGRILDWYIGEIKQMHESNTIDCLCFVEKPFSFLGAVTLAGALVAGTGISGALYRSAYWDVGARFTSARPPFGSRVVLVYDVAISGDLLLDAARAMQEQFGAIVVAAFVAYDFTNGAAERLREAGIELRSYTDRYSMSPKLRMLFAYYSEANPEAMFANAEALQVDARKQVDDAFRAAETRLAAASVEAGDSWFQHRG